MNDNIESLMLAAAAQPAAAVDPLAFLDDINTAAPKSGKRKSYPSYPDNDGTGADLAARIIELSEAKAQLETNNKLLGELVTPFYFRNAAGRSDVESSVRVACPNGAVLVTFKAQAKKMPDASAAKQVSHIIGKHEAALFRHTFDLKIDGDEIPAASVAAVVTELKAVFAKHGCTKALKVEKQFVPYPSFHTQRHVLFTPEQNLEIHRAIPVITAVKTKDVT
jgi:hypothetical protein